MYSVVISFIFSCVGEIVNSLRRNCYGYSLSIELMVINLLNKHYIVFLGDILVFNTITFFKLE
jgi:hypothetical protein